MRFKQVMARNLNTYDELRTHAVAKAKKDISKFNALK
jgi:hypothetical protein